MATYPSISADPGVVYVHNGDLKLSATGGRFMLSDGTELTAGSSVPIGDIVNNGGNTITGNTLHISDNPTALLTEGNVAFGSNTTASGTRLYVSGNSYITSTLKVGDNILMDPTVPGMSIGHTSTPTAALDVTGDIKVSGNMDAYELRVQGSSGTNHFFALENGNAPHFGIAGGSGNQIHGNSDGNFYAIGKVAVGGSDHSDTTLHVTGNVHATEDITTSGGYIETKGAFPTNITGAPYKMDAVGVAMGRYNTDASGIEVCYNETGGEGIIDFAYNTGSGENNYQHRITSKSTGLHFYGTDFDTGSTPTLSLVGQNVGINQATATEALEVAGNIKANRIKLTHGDLKDGDGNYVTMEDTITSGTVYEFPFLLTGGTYAGDDMQNRYGLGMYYRDWSGTGNMTITPCIQALYYPQPDPNIPFEQNKPEFNQSIHLNPEGGNVGIGLGTTEPTQRLDVAGNIKATGSIDCKEISCFHSDGNSTKFFAADYTADNASSLVYFGIHDSSQNSGAGRNMIQGLANGNFNAWGKVGVGQDVGTEALEVAGVIKSSERVVIVNTTASSTTAPHMSLQYNGDFHSNVYRNSTPYSDASGATVEGGSFVVSEYYPTFATPTHAQATVFWGQRVSGTTVSRVGGMHYLQTQYVGRPKGGGVDMGGFHFAVGSVVPATNGGTLSDGTINLGSGGNRYNTLFAATGTINTSDRNSKRDETDYSAAEERVAQALVGMMKKFRYKDAYALKGESARYHAGIIAQDVESAFTAEGLNAEEYGMFCKDPTYYLTGTDTRLFHYWYREDDSTVYQTNVPHPVVDENSPQHFWKSVEPQDFNTLPEGVVEQRYSYSVRYEEILCFVVANMNKSLEARIAALEAA